MECFDLKLGALIKKADEINKLVEDCTNKVRNLELTLSKLPFKFSFESIVESETCEDGSVTDYCIAWEFKLKSGVFRLFVVIVKTKDEARDILLHRPLIEARIGVRVKMEPHLTKFLQEYIEEIEKNSNNLDALFKTSKLPTRLESFRQEPTQVGFSNNEELFEEEIILSQDAKR